MPARGHKIRRKPVAEIIARLGPAFHLFLMVHGITRLIGYFPSFPSPNSSSDRARKVANRHRFNPCAGPESLIKPMETAARELGMG